MFHDLIRFSLLIIIFIIDLGKTTFFQIMSFRVNCGHGRFLQRNFRSLSFEAIRKTPNFSGTNK